MKTTPRRPRSDSAKSAIAAAQAAALGPIAPPDHVHLRAADRPFWAAVMKARARDTWTDSDLVMAANLARAYADIETLQAKIDAEGFVIDGKAHPAIAIMETMTRRVASLSRLLHVHAQATVGRSEDASKGLALERQAREQEPDDLIPRLRSV
jgi:phage terminase small subunit